MRTTITLEDDVAASLKRLGKRQGGLTANLPGFRCLWTAPRTTKLALARFRNTGEPGPGRSDCSAGHRARIDPLLDWRRLRPLSKFALAKSAFGL